MTSNNHEKFGLRKANILLPWTSSLVSCSCHTPGQDSMTGSVTVCCLQGIVLLHDVQPPFWVIAVLWLKILQFFSTGLISLTIRLWYGLVGNVPALPSRFYEETCFRQCLWAVVHCCFFAREWVLHSEQPHLGVDSHLGINTNAIIFLFGVRGKCFEEKLCWLRIVGIFCCLTCMEPVSVFFTSVQRLREKRGNCLWPSNLPGQFNLHRLLVCGKPLVYCEYHFDCDFERSQKVQWPTHEDNE